jgi:hypothetical protein
MGNRGPFSGGKARPGRDADHSPHLVPRSWLSRSYTSSPPSAFTACSGTALLYFTFCSVCNSLQLRHIFSVISALQLSLLPYEDGGVWVRFRCCRSMQRGLYSVWWDCNAFRKALLFKQRLRRRQPDETLGHLWGIFIFSNALRLNKGN